MDGFSLHATAFILLIPLFGAAVLVALPGYWVTARLNVVFALLTFGAALVVLLGERPPPQPFFLVDDLNIIFVVINSFVGLTTSVFSASYISHELEIGRLTPAYLQFYHAMYQALMFSMNLALLANNIGLMWVAIELATLTTVLMVGIYRTHEALEAAWKYFILGSVGIALALFGTILFYVAASAVIGEGLEAMRWTTLIPACRQVRSGVAQPGLRLPDARLRNQGRSGASPRLATRRPCRGANADLGGPVGLLLNVALYAVLRFKLLLAANPETIAPGPLMVTMGLISLIFAAFMLYRRRDIKRMFAYSSIEHMGIITFAFGMGGPLANFAGLLHMVMHSLTKSAIFFAVGHIAQVKGTQKIGDIRGLTETHPSLGWGLTVGVVAIGGLPPLGIFMSEFLIVSSTFAREPLLALFLVAGLLLSFGALFLRLHGLAFGPPTGSTVPLNSSYLPMTAHLSLVAIAGVYLPPPLVAWFQHVAGLLG